MNGIATTASRRNEAHAPTARATEETVVRLPLASGPFDEPDSLTVFKSSEERFRLVFESSSISKPGNKIIIPQTIYIREDKLIPRYALPNLDSPDMEIAIFSRNEEALYKFNTLQDVYNFQTALTGYNVSHDQQNIRCQFSDESSSLDCRGRIQLWQEPITVQSCNDESRSSDSSTIGGPKSFSERTTSIFGSIAPSLRTTHTVHRAAGGWEAEGVKLANLMIFTEMLDRKKRKRFAVVSVELGLGARIDPSECRCSRNYDSCSKLVLTIGKKNKFQVRVLYSELDTLGQVNTNTFDLLPFRTPQHPSFNKLTTKQTDYLVLKFSTLQEKRLFDEELRLRFRVRDAQIQNQLDFTKDIRRREAQRPGREEPLSFLRSPSLAPSMISLPPKIDVPDNGPTLIDAMRSMSLAELTGNEYLRMENEIVEVSGDKPLVEMAASPMLESVGMIGDRKDHQTFYDLPGAIPWFPTA